MKQDSHSMPTNQPQSELIAIIGIGCIFPKARNLAEYWTNLKEGVDAITEVPLTHWDPKDYFHPDPKARDRVYAKMGGFLPTIDFNPLDFGILPNAIEAIDTTQLFSLVATQEALNDAGYGADRKFNRERVSVILGITGTLELVIPLGARLGHPIWRQALKEAGVEDAVAQDVVDRISNSYVEWQENSFPGLLGNVAAGRIANRFDFGGTNCTVDAACASSLSAVHLAMLELSSGQADMVVTGGVDTFNHIFMYACFSKTPALSPSGHARPFDQNSDGTTLGEGVGIIVLKRLADAERDGDKIYAVIKGIGTSSDGKGNAIYAPNAEGQIRAFRNTYANANVTPDTVELMEAHGTGTKVGDAAEMKSMTDVYSGAQKNGPWCALGSVKSQIGHTKSAAGVAGLIKTTMALYHKVLPPTIKVERPAPTLMNSQTPFYVNTQKRPWLPPYGHPRRAAVSAFGFGGSNFHCILEEYGLEKKEIDWSGNVQILAFSAENPAQLETSLNAFDPTLPWSFLRGRSAQFRQQFDAKQPYRLLMVVENEKSDVAKMLTNARTMLAKNKEKSSWNTPDGIYYGRGEVPGKLGLVFPGQGSQYVGMLRDAACQFPQFQDVLAIANQVFQQNQDSLGSQRLSDLIYPYPAFNEDTRQKNEAVLRSTQVAQPAIGAVSLGLFKVLEYLGVHPELVAGHSYGELVALCIAGVLDIETFFVMSKLRGQLMGQKTGDKGSMVAVQADVNAVEQVMKDEQFDLVIANKNSPQQTVLSGATSEIERAGDVFKQHGFRCKQLQVAAAFHSRFVSDTSGTFREALQKVNITPPHIPVFANSTGECYPEDPTQIRELLAGQLANPVEFIKMIENMYDSGVRTFLEVGPLSQMNGLIKVILEGKTCEVFSVDTSAGKRSGEADLARALSQLASLGYNVHISAWDDAAPIYKENATSKTRTMAIPISGANYFKPKPPKPPVKVQPASPISHSATPKTSSGQTSKLLPTNNANQESYEQKPPQQVVPQPVKPITKTMPQVQPAKKDVPTSLGASSQNQEISQSVQPAATSRNMSAGTIDLSEALRMTQENLRMLQQFQQQTADLHRQFLEGQEAARQTFERLLTQQHQLLLGTALTTGSPELSQEQPQTVSPTVNQQNITTPSIRAEMPIIQVPPAKSAVSEAKSMVIPSPPADHGRIAKILLEVVAEKTGYPVDMLDLDMGLDADLGIDSIKRVEILSALQENLPNLPEISSDQIGTIQTLRQVMDFLSVNVGSSVQQPEVVGERPSAAVDSDQIERILLQVVAEKTGYPEDMLDLNMGLDADLGIDSIKRVEIFSELQGQLPDVPEIGSEQIGQIQTLQQIVEFLSQISALAEEGIITKTSETEVESEPVETEPELSFISLERSLVMPTNLPSLETRQTISLAPGATIWITDDETELTAAVEAELQKRGFQPQRIFLKQLSNLKTPEKLDGLVILAPRSDKIQTTFLKDAFKVLQAAGTGLRKKTSVFVTVSRLDGVFGFGNLNPNINPISGGLAGLAKTVGREWPEVHSKALDVDAGYNDVDPIAKAIVDAMFCAGPLEIGISTEGRTTLHLRPVPLDGIEIIHPLTPADVVVMAGGARGVTAECAVALARTYQPTIVLIGRSPVPTAEPQWLSGLSAETDIKSAIIRNASRKMTPKEVGEEYRRIIANRELQRNIERITAAGSQVIYRSVDVRDSAAVQALVAEVQQRFGTITGLIHGAGVLADRKIEDKTEEQFNKVYDTKVEGLINFLNVLSANPLKAIVLFSSTTARLGRVGQVDYAIANEVLNKLAQQQARLRPECRVVAINWGPWAGGMVTPALEKVFEDEGIGLIPLQAGAEYMVQELSLKPHQNAPVEVVVLKGEPTKMDATSEVVPILDSMPQVGTTSEVPSTLSSAPALHLAFERTLDIEHHPFLTSHVINGRAVLPAAITIEWLAHAALHDNPGLMLHGFDELRILKGVILQEGESYTIQVLVGNATKDGQYYRVPVEMRGIEANGQNILHARAEFILTTKLPQSQLSINIFDTQPYSHQNGDIYQKYLFHGPDFQGIEQVEGYSVEGIIARSKAAPHPSDWFKYPLRNHWLTDPLMLDSSFQMLILWSIEHYQSPSLPTFVRRYRQFQTKFSAHGGRIVAQVTKSDQRRALANIEFLNQNGELIARMEDYECTIDPSLQQAFRRNKLRGKS